MWAHLCRLLIVVSFEFNKVFTIGCPPVRTVVICVGLLHPPVKAVVICVGLLHPPVRTVVICVGLLHPPAPLPVVEQWLS